MKNLKIKPILKRFFKLKRLGLLFSLFLALSVIFVLAQPVFAAGGFWGTLGTSLAQVLGYIIYGLIIWPFSLLLTLFIWLLTQFAQFNDFINAPAVAVGWSLIRDLCNMFFVLVLLIIAFATILKIESYHYKKTLPKLLIAAILINFSRTICGIIIDFSQVIMLTFVNGFKDIAVGNLINRLGLAELLQFGRPVVDDLDASSVLGAFVLVAIMILVSTVVVFVLIITLVIRIVMLWLLVILSPLAFLFSAVPIGQKYASQWWYQFGRYVMVGPLLAFFLWFSFYIMSGPELDPGSLQAGSFTGQGVISEAQRETAVSAGISTALEEGNIMSFIIVIALLIGSLIATRQMGIVGGNIASGALSALQRTGLAPFKRGAEYLERKVFLQTPVLRALTPSYWRGFWERGDKLREEAVQKAMGAGRFKSEKIFKGKEAAVPELEMAFGRVINEKIKRFMEELSGAANAKEKMVELAIRARQTGGAEGEDMRLAIMELVTKQGNFDDLHQMLVAEGVVHDDETAQQWGFKDWDQAKSFNDESIRALGSFMVGGKGFQEKYDPTVIAKKLVAEQGYSEEEAKIEARKISKENAKKASFKDKMRLRTLFTMGQVARNVGHWEQVFAGADAQGNYFITDDDETFDEVKGESKKRGIRDFLKQVAPHTMRSRLWDAEKKEWVLEDNTDKMTDFQKRFLAEILGPQYSRELHQMQGRTAEQIVGEPFFDKETGQFLDEKAAKNFEKLYEMNPKAVEALYKAWTAGNALSKDVESPKSAKDLGQFGVTYGPTEILQKRSRVRQLEDEIREAQEEEEEAKGKEERAKKKEKTAKTEEEKGSAKEEREDAERERKRAEKEHHSKQNELHGLTRSLVPDAPEPYLVKKGDTALRNPMIEFNQTVKNNPALVKQISQAQAESKVSGNWAMNPDQARFILLKKAISGISDQMRQMKDNTGIGFGVLGKRVSAVDRMLGEIPEIPSTDDISTVLSKNKLSASEIKALIDKFGVS